MLINKIISNIKINKIIGNQNLDLDIEQLSTHSKNVSPTTLFFAHKGVLNDGRKYLKDVIDAGVGAIIADDDNFDFSPFENANIPIILVTDAKKAKAELAEKFYLSNNPNLLLIGVTGTNGKTSTCWIISKALSAIGKPIGYVGTIGMRYQSVQDGKEIFFDNNTTSPDVLDLYKFIGTAETENIHGFAIETSSHSLDQKRLGDINWDVAVFTNLTQDHLDYHKTLENYAEAKAKLFKEELKNSTKENKLAVINVNDAVGRDLLAWCKQNLPNIKTISYSQNPKQPADCSVKDYKFFQDKTEMTLDLFGKEINFNSKLVGDYNVENVLASATVLAGLGYNEDEIAKGLSSVPPVPGRLERIEHDKISIFIDYAHTPDALFRVQDSLRKLTDSKLITVFGCGGDRDRTKRPKMAFEVEKLSDFAIVTSDNPRTENPTEIVNEILDGFTGPVNDKFEYIAVVDRREALEHAINIAKLGDIILIAGKGHEDYQEINGVKHHFSDQEEIRKILG